MYSIVIVDDSVTNRAIYSQLVRSLGQNVSVNAFGDAAGALDWLVTNSADLIVTDYEMPRIDGDEFITRFRALPGASRVPIMMITVCGQRQKKLRALESGATDFLRAPVDHFEFITRARNLLKLSRSAGQFPVPAPEKNPAEDGTRALLERCGARDYAIHVVEIDQTGPAPDLSEALRGHLRESDFVARLDPLRYAVLQNEVVAPRDAKSLARRLSSLRGLFPGVAALRAGAALPLPGEGAAACLRAAIQAAGENSPVVGSESERWRLAPAVDLATGALAGAQLLDGADEAAFGDPEALRVALACGARLGRAAQDLRLALRLNLGGRGAEAAMLRLPSFIARSGAELESLDLLIPVGEIGADAAATENLAHALKALGPRLIIDLGALRRNDAAPYWPALLRALGEGWCGALRFSGADASSVERARELKARIARELGKPPALRAADTPSSELLPALRRAGVGWAQGACFGSPFALRDFGALLAPREGEPGLETRALPA
jgi:CheY-like chemotaxis protein